MSSLSQARPLFAADEFDAQGVSDDARGDGLMRAECAAIRVAYLVGTLPVDLEAVPDAVEILIPSEDAIFEIAYSASAGSERRSLLLRGPQVSIIPGEQLDASYRPRRSDMLVIALDQAFYQAKVRRALPFETPNIVEHCTVVDPFIREIGNALRNEFRMRRTPNTVYLESWAGVLAIYVAATYGRRTSIEQSCVGLSLRKVERVIAFIQQHLADTVLVEHLAATVHMSVYHFTRMFKQTVGSSPHVYITAQRMEHAKRLLRNSDLPLVDVAALSGFQTQAHFTGVFRKCAGMTPREFRLNHQARYGELTAR